MPSAAAYLSNSSTHFLRLPLEIREDIYIRVFPCSTFRLSEQIGSSLESTVHETSTTALLMTCHAIYEDATPIFYQEARIHFSMSWKNTSKTIDSTHIRLPLLTHVSIGFCCCRLFDQYLYRSQRMQERPCDVKEAADNQIAKCIDSISANCPLLRTFTLHLLSACTEYETGLPEWVDGSFLQTVLERPTYSLEGSEIISYSSARSMDALKRLTVRDTVSIVAVATEHSPERGDMFRFTREAFAPTEDWNTLVLRGWPGITLSHAQKSEVNDLLCDLYPCSRIRLWYYQPPGSKALVLPHHKLLGEVRRNDHDNTDDDNDDDSNGYSGDWRDAYYFWDV